MELWTKAVGLLRPAVALAALLAAGCATMDDVIPQDGPDMRTIYHAHMQGAGGVSGTAVAREAAQVRPPAPESTDLRGWTREAASEIEQVFPLLPNPMLVLYVFPHLSAEGAPVPGYTTAFRMYAADEFALPGEDLAP